MVHLAVIVPVYNASRTLARCLERLRNQLGPHDELVVVDDGSSDGSATIAAAAGARVLSQPRGGAGAARNLGAARTSAPWLLFVDADVYVPDGVLQRIRDGIAAIDGKDALVAIYEAAPMHRNVGSAYLHLIQAQRMHALRPGPSSIFGSSCAAVRRDAFERIGGFPTDQRFAGSEDRIFGENLGARRVVLRTDIQVRHDKRLSVRAALSLNARRAFSEACWRARRQRLGVLMGRDSETYLGVGYLVRLLSAPLALAAPIFPLAVAPYLLASYPVLRFAMRHAGTRAAAVVACVGWLDSMIVLAAGASGALYGRLTRGGG